MTETFQPEDDDQSPGITIEKVDDQPSNDEDITSNSPLTEQETVSASKTVDEVDIENTDTLNVS